jgi:hypothetical protein
VFDVPLDARGVRGGLLKDSEDSIRAKTAADRKGGREAIFEVRCVVGVKIGISGIGR